MFQFVKDKITRKNILDWLVGALFVASLKFLFEVVVIFLLGTLTFASLLSILKFPALVLLFCACYYFPKIKFGWNVVRTHISKKVKKFFKMIRTHFKK